MKTLVTALIVLVAIAAGALIAMYSGAYNVGTSNHDNALVNWALDTGMTRSVQQHARGLSAPSLADTAMIARAPASTAGAPGATALPGGLPARSPKVSGRRRRISPRRPTIGPRNSSTGSSRTG